MKFDHTVKYNGEYYPAGTEVPMPEECTNNEEVAKEVMEETEEVSIGEKEKPKHVKNKAAEA